MLPGYSYSSRCIAAFGAWTSMFEEAHCDPGIIMMGIQAQS